MHPFRLILVILVLLSLEAVRAQDHAAQAAHTLKKQASEFNNEAFKLLQQGRPEEAKLLLKRALSLDSLELGYYLNMGDACHQTKDWPLALKTFNQAVRAFPNEADLYYYRGEIFNKQSEFKQALSDFSTAIRLAMGAKDTPARLYLYYFNRGVAHLKLKQFAEANLDFTETLKLNDSHHGAFANRGFARYNLKD